MAREKKRVTISTIARHLGLSVTTVSFALNNLGEQYGIADATVKKIREAARKLNYVPNAMARSLRHQKTGNIGVIFPHLRNDWAHHIMDGMYDVLEKEGLVPFIVNHRDSPEQESREIDLLIQRRAEGIICNPLADSTASYRRAVDNGVPLVFFGDTLEELPEVSSAAWDPKDVSLAVQHLVDIGRKRIAYLGCNDRRLITRARNDSVRMTLQKNGLSADTPHFILSNPGEAMEPKLTALLKSGRQPPDALFTLYDDTAFDAIDILTRLGVNVPNDVAVATLGDSKLAGPRGYNLTTVFAPVRDEGLQAAKIMVHLLRKPGTTPIHKLVPGGTLIIRGTTGGIAHPRT